MLHRNEILNNKENYVLLYLCLFIKSTIKIPTYSVSHPTATLKQPASKKTAK